jgi:dihydrofolate reductase
MMRKIIAYVAISADGYIARNDGDVEWLNRPRTAGDYGMAEFYRSIDTVLWGRKTYDMALGFKKKGLRGAESDEKIKNYVFSHQPAESSSAGTEFVDEPIKLFAKRLRALPGKNIWMMGGAGIIASFLDEGEIDEFIIHVIPTFIGEGIPLVQPSHRSIELALISSQAFSDGVVRLHYSVAKRQSTKKNKPKKPVRRTQR